MNTRSRFATFLCSAILGGLALGALIGICTGEAGRKQIAGFFSDNITPIAFDGEGMCRSEPHTDRLVCDARESMYRAAELLSPEALTVLEDVERGAGQIMRWQMLALLIENNSRITYEHRQRQVAMYEAEARELKERLLQKIAALTSWEQFLIAKYLKAHERLKFLRGTFHEKGKPI